jgi:hypothetical protein
MALSQLRCLGVFLTVSLLASCSSAFYKKQAIYKSDRFYIYTLAEADYPDDEEIRPLLKPVKPFPPGSAEGLLNLFTYLRVEKKGLVGASTYPVFYRPQLAEMAPVLKDVIEAGQPYVRYLLVTRFDPYNTVLSKMRRTTLLFWNDGEKVHLVFGEIHSELIGDDFINDEKWIDVPPVNLRRAPDNTRLLDSTLYSFEKVGDFTHLMHIVIPLNEMLALKPDPRFMRSDTAQTSPEEMSRSQEKKGDVAERLKKLEQLRAAGLITEKEYEEQRRRILSEL